MVQGGDADVARSDETVSFARALERLKSRGSALLIVGTVPKDVYCRLSHRMLGDGGTAPRRRLVVRQSDGEGRDGRLEDVARRTPEWTRIVEYRAHSRGASAASPDGDHGADGPQAPSGPGTTHRPDGSGSGETAADGRDPLATVVDGSITELGMEVAKVIEQFDGIASELDPAELRVAFDCLPVLLTQYRRETVFRFVHVLTNNVRAVGGMGHFWLPQERSAEVVRVLEPLFDATVELRLDGSQPKQRWHFRDADLSSEWLALE
jgi:hypothetical protein